MKTSCTAGIGNADTVIRGAAGVKLANDEQSIARSCVRTNAKNPRVGKSLHSIPLESLPGKVHLVK